MWTSNEGRTKGPKQIWVIAIKKQPPGQPTICDTKNIKFFKGGSRFDVREAYQRRRIFILVTLDSEANRGLGQVKKLHSVRGGQHEMCAFKMAAHYERLIQGLELASACQKTPANIRVLTAG